MAYEPTFIQGGVIKIKKNQEKKRILVIENDEDLLFVYSTRLTVEGFSVATWDSGNGVIEEVLRFKPDLVVLDIMLPFMDGLDALELIRQNPATKNIKVIVVSALSIEKEKKRAEQLGVEEYLVKSHIMLDDMVDHIKERLGIHPPLEELVE